MNATRFPYTITLATAAAAVLLSAAQFAGIDSLAAPKRRRRRCGAGRRQLPLVVVVAAREAVLEERVAQRRRRSSSPVTRCARSRSRRYRRQRFEPTTASGRQHADLDGHRLLAAAGDRALSGATSPKSAPQASVM